MAMFSSVVMPDGTARDEKTKQENKKQLEL